MLLFNWFGYRLLTYYMEDKANIQLEAQLDDNSYEEAQLISIKAPITHLSYYNNSREFERVDGQISIGGVEYKYVKRRIYNDSLEVLCIPDQVAMKFKAVKNDLFKYVNDLHHPGQGKKAGANSENSKSFSTDYYPTQDVLLSADLHFKVSARYSSDFFFTPSIYTLVQEQPPENA
ncbi:MAG TPA: hypothetical protein VK563_06615 [Puia sp.]|nr:hypothetical protein [Puia sp.]